MGAEPPVPARPRRTARRPLVVVVAGALAVGVPVCAGLYYGLHRGGAGPSPRDVVLTAARLAGTQSVRMDVRADETFTVSGVNLPQMSALSGQTMTVQMQMDMQDQRHGNLTFTGSIMGQAVTLSGVVYDGDVYLSTDGGASYRSVPLTSSVSSQYTADSALQYLNDVSTVTDTGPSSVDGLRVERYHADLDGSKLSGVLRTALGTLKSDVMQTVLGSMRYTGGSLDATIDDAGRIRTETGFFDLTMDMGALDPRLSGAAITVHGTFDGRFSNYGQPVTVTRPTNVSGAFTLP